MITNHSAKRSGRVNICVHLFLWLLFPLAIFGQDNPGANLDIELSNAYQNILKLRLNSGNEALSKLKKTQSGVAMFYYIENLGDIIGLLLDETSVAYKLKGKKAKTRIGYLNDLPDSDPYKKFVLAEIKLSWAFIKLKFGDSFSAGWDIKQANKLISENENNFPDFIPNIKSRATLNLLIGSVPSKYNWILNIFGLSGSINTGLKQLQQIQSSKHFLSLEASIIRCLAGVYLLQEKALITSFHEIYKNQPDNLLVKFAYAAICIRSHKSEEALNAIIEAEKLGANYAKVHYLSYLKGKIMLQKKNYSLALLYFNTFLKNYKGRNNIKDASFQLFLSYWLNNNDKKARQAFNFAKSQGAAISTGDKYVDRILTDNIYPHKVMMQFRLATDGGYYDLALEDIRTIKSTTLPDAKLKTEFNYRQARYFHLTENIEKAVNYYRATIKSAEKQNWYYAPSSALQLGHIYLQRNETKKAMAAYRKVTEYKKHPYKQSLDQQANAAISKIEGL